MLSKHWPLSFMCCVPLCFTLTVPLSCPGGVLEVYMTGGSDGASYCKPKKIHKPEILDPKKYLALKFPTQKQDYKCTLYCLLNNNSFFGTQVAERKFEWIFFTSTDRNGNPKQKVRSELRPPKKTRIFLRPKKIRDRSLDPKKYRACKFSTQKNTSDPPPHHVYFEYPPPPLGSPARSILNGKPCKILPSRGISIILLVI